MLPRHCLRCGVFLDESNEPLAGIGFCRACLTGRQPPLRDAALPLPPRHVLAGRIPLWSAGCLAAWVVAVFLVGLPRDLATLPPSCGSLEHFRCVVTLLHAAMLLAVAMALCGVAGAGILWLPTGHAAWERPVLDALQIARLPPRTPPGGGGPWLAVQVQSRRRGFGLPVCARAGLLAECSQGLAFLGADGTRLVIPREAVDRVEVGRAPLWPPRSALHLRLAGGASQRFALVHHPTPAENRRSLQAMADRLRAGA